MEKYTYLLKKRKTHAFTKGDKIGGAADSAGRAARRVKGHRLRRWRRRDEEGDWFGERDASGGAAPGWPRRKAGLCG